MENKLKEPIEEAKIILMDFAYGKYNTESLNVEKQCDWKAALIHDSYKKWLKELLEGLAVLSDEEIYEAYESWIDADKDDTFQQSGFREIAQHQLDRITKTIKERING